MKRRNTISLLFASAVCLLLGLVMAQAQGSVPTASSEITAAAMPRGAERLSAESVPAEFNAAFDNLLKQGAGKVAGGDREVLAWTGDFKTPASVSRSILQVEASFRDAGWKYEPQGKSGDLEVFGLLKESAPRRVVLGFFVPGEDVLVCALMEVVMPGEKAVKAASGIDRPARGDASAKVVTVDADTQWVNVMGTEMPPMPHFPALQPKPGRVRGYVKDWSGKPLAGAEIGVRSSYLAGYYSGSQGKTDQNGYYEFAVPKGAAHFYNAGYQIEWGDGVAAVSLHPADGGLDSFVTADGAVENFVMLPYGVTSRENLQENAHLPSTFYGGAVFLNWYGVAADDNNAPPFAIRAGTTVEITLTPEGTMLDGGPGQKIVIRKKAGISGAFRIHNIPLGKYRIEIKANGTPLKMEDNRGTAIHFGMTPQTAVGSASILFIPDSVKASMVAPQHGGWNWIGLGLSTP